MLFLRRQSRYVSGALAETRRIRLSTSRMRLSPVMAAEQFLPPGKLEAVLETVSFVDTTFDSPAHAKTSAGPFRARVQGRSSPMG